MKQSIVKKLQNCEKAQFSTRELMDMVHKGMLNLSPPYQRNEVWRSGYQSDLITSIMMNYPVPNLTFVKDGEDGYIVLDGKQRITSILKFYEGNLSALHVDLDKDVSRNDLENTMDKSYSRKWINFTNAKLSVTILPPMEWLEQRDTFMMLNQSMQLSTNEKIYCQDFHTKSLMEFVWGKTLRNYSYFSRKKVHEKMQRGFKNLRFVHSILFKVFGYRLDEVIDVTNENRGHTTIEIEKSSTCLQEIAINKNKIDGQFNEDELKKIGIDRQIKCFLGVVKAFQGVIEWKPMNSKWFEATIRDALMYFTYQDFINVFTTSQIKEHAGKLHDVLSQYQLELSKNGLISGAKQDGNSLSQRLKLLDTTFKTLMAGVDLNKKRIELTETDKILAKAKSDGKCAICGKILTDKNCHIDHVDPKSKSSATLHVALCDTCNLDKSNLSRDRNDILQSYFNSNLTPTK